MKIEIQNRLQMRKIKIFKTTGADWKRCSFLNLFRVSDFVLRISGSLGAHRFIQPHSHPGLETHAHSPLRPLALGLRPGPESKKVIRPLEVALHPSGMQAVNLAAERLQRRGCLPVLAGELIQRERMIGAAA